MSQNYFYPPSGGGSSSNASVGANNTTAPTSSTEIAYVNGGGNLTPVSPSNPLPVTPASGSTFNENLTQIAGNAVAAGSGASSTGTLRVILSTDSPLSTGASTSALQTTGNNSLSSIDSKTPALGQALAAASVPVVLTAAQLTTLTPLSSVTVTQPTGTNLHTVVDSGAVTVSQATGTNLHTVVDSGSITVTQATGTNLHVVVDSTAIAATAATSALQTAGNNSLSSIDGKTPALGQALAAASVPVVLTAAQLTTLTPLSTVAVTQSGTWTVQPGNTANTTAWLVNSQVIGQSGSTNANSSVASAALEASHVIKASAGRLFQLTGVNTKATAQYIQVFNSTTVPADTTVPILLAYVPAGGNFSFDFGQIGRYFSTGIAVSNSSTAATKTIGSSDCWFNAEYL